MAGFIESKLSVVIDYQVVDDLSGAIYKIFQAPLPFKIVT